MINSISKEIIEKIPAGVARRYRVIPKGIENRALVLFAARKPTANDEADLVFLAGSLVSFQFVETEEFEVLLAEYCSMATTTLESVFSDMERFQESESKRYGLDLASAESSDSPINLVDAVLSFAIGAQASDVHFEPNENTLIIRARIDGVLQTIGTASEQLREAIISRAKLMARMDVAEKRRPQDGRFTMSGANKAVDIRVSSLPTAYGEKVVMRILDATSQQFTINQLGLNSASHTVLVETLSQPQGIVLVTGPTGSGKTTTLYSCLRYLASPEINIMTIEDPKEYDLPGVNQSQVKPEIGYTFAAALRSILRQDPDVIMVGEIRDTETAQIAVRASLTGHLVLSTVHTNDAISTIDRLLDMGIEPYLVASSLRLVLSQRLVRRICRSCGGAGLVNLTSDDDRLKSSATEAQPHTSIGCTNCRFTGYTGREAIFEMLRISDSWREAIRKLEYRRPELGNSDSLLSTLAESAAQLVKGDVTSAIEVARVLGA